MIMVRTIVAVLSFCLVCGQALGQELGPVTQISLEQGLSDRTIKDIVKDRYGYLWIATRNGLNQYDGLHIETYDNYPERKTRISAKDIRKVICRDDGSKIIQYEANRRFIDYMSRESTLAQKIFLNRENGVLGPVEVITLDQRTGDVFILVENDSTLVIQQLNDNLQFDSLFSVVDYPARPSSMYRLLVLESGQIWLNDNNTGLLLIDTTGRIRNEVVHDSLGVPHSYGLTEIFYEDSQGRIWVSFINTPGLWEYNEAAEYFTPFIVSQGNELLTRLWEDKQGNVVIANKPDQHVLNMYLVKSDDVIRPYTQFLRVATDINEMYSEDFESLVFLGTNSGVKKVNQTKKKVRNYLSDDENPELETSLRGIAALPSGHVMFTGEQNSWFVYDPGLDTISTITPDITHALETEYCNCARELIYDPEGFVWGVRYSEQYRAEIIRLSLLDTTFSFYPFPYKLQSFTLGQDDRLWLVSGEDQQPGRLTAFDKVNGTFHHYFDADDTNPLSEFEPTFVYEDADQIKWVGTTDGLLRIDVGDGASELFQYSESDYYGLNSNQIYCITQDADRNIWIGTDAGVNIYDPIEGEFRFFDTRDGLADNNVCGILQDDKNNLWLSTYNGLSYFDVTLTSFRNFGVGDGFSQNQFNRYSYGQDELGNFYLGGVNGLSVFHPNELLDRELNAPILVSAMSYYDQTEGAIMEHVHNLQQVKQVTLPATNRYFECSFALADYSNPQQNQYQYKLEGLDIDWNHLGSQNEIRFNNLPSGTYTLRIRGADRNLNVSKQEYTLIILVQEYFYKKAWFLLLCLLLLTLLIYLFHRIKLQQAINMERLRTKISSDLHDDVGGVLSGLAMQTELLQYSAKESDKPKLERISEMSRNAMAQMRDVIWATDARKDKFEDLLIRMKEFAAEILFARSISYAFHVENINKERRIPVQVRQNLYLIFKEALTNVAKHSEATHVDISIRKEGSKISMKISDNGIGKISDNGSVSSINGAGLQNMEMRAKAIQADLAIEKDDGFCVYLEMKSFV